MSGLETETRRRQHVLVVDSWPYIGSVVRTCLESLSDYRVSAAVSGDQALPLLDADRPDLVMLDAVLPGMTGIELAGEAIRRDIPVLLMTGGTAIDNRFEYLGWPHIRKPFRIDDLLAEVRSAIGKCEQNIVTIRASLIESLRIAAGLRETIDRSIDLRNRLRDTMARSGRFTDPDDTR